jgi:mRNA interferase MazF
MAKGDIVLIIFPFTDLSGNKLRPAVVIADNNFDVTVFYYNTNTTVGEYGCFSFS